MLLRVTSVNGLCLELVLLNQCCLVSYILFDVFYTVQEHVVVHCTKINFQRLIEKQSVTVTLEFIILNFVKSLSLYNNKLQDSSLNSLFINV